MGKGHPEMVEQASHLDIGGATFVLTDILVIFFVLCTAQVMMNNKNKNQQPLTFCKKRSTKKGYHDQKVTDFSVLFLL